MQQLAQGIASLGRNNDTQLVHMTPGEVQGLQKLAMSHGGSLTINPSTGLVEAGILERLLPSVVSAAAYGMGMGAPGAAIAGGLTTAATTNDFKKGVASGLIMYGIGNATEGLKGMGAEVNTKGLEASADAANQLGQTAYDKTFAEAQAKVSGMENTAYEKSLAEERARQAANPTDIFGNPSASTFGQSPEQVADVAKKQTLDQFTRESQATAQAAREGAANNAPGPSSLSNLQAGLGKFGDAPVDATKELYGKMNKAGLFGLGAGALTLADRFSPKPATTAPAPVVTKPFTARYTPKTSFPTEEERRLLGSKEYNYFPTAAAGGSTEDIKGMAQGGIAALPNEYAAGGKLLSGAGDGMSDSIPAVIQGAKPQRAALADGEFVVPADVVSHLGNGSTKAGAQHLYTMMDKVRKARTGNPKQGKQINPHKFLTA